jgi:hypothetical protein
MKEIPIGCLVRIHNHPFPLPSSCVGIVIDAYEDDETCIYYEVFLCNSFYWIDDLHIEILKFPKRTNSY